MLIHAGTVWMKLRAPKISFDALAEAPYEAIAILYFTGEIISILTGATNRRVLERGV